MITLSASILFWTRLRPQLPDEDLQEAPLDFQAQLRVPSQAARRKFAAACLDFARQARDGDGKDAEDKLAQMEQLQTEFALQHIADWKDVHDENGAAAPYDGEKMAQLFDRLPQLRSQVLAKLAEAAAGKGGGAAPAII